MNSKDKKSLFEDHIQMLEKDSSQWTLDQQREGQRIASLALPNLNLTEPPPYKVSWHSFLKTLSSTKSLSFGLAVAMALLVFVNIKNMNLEGDILRAKGTSRVSFYYERGGDVSPLSDETQLKDGDRVGANIIVNTPSVAYWAVVDSDFHLLVTNQEIIESQIHLQPGKSSGFESSFTLTSPNQGEHLVVMICEKVLSKNENMNETLNAEFINKIMNSEQVSGRDCVFVGRRLRKVESQ